MYLKDQCHEKFYHFWTKRSYNSFIYVKNNIKTSRERNPPGLERGTSYALFSPILEAKNARNVSDNLKKIKPAFFKSNSLWSSQFMTRDNYQQFWNTGVVLISKLDHYFTVSVNPKTFWGFEIIPNPRDTAPLRLVYSNFFFFFFAKLLRNLSRQLLQLHFD